MEGQRSGERQPRRRSVEKEPVVYDDQPEGIIVGGADLEEVKKKLNDTVKKNTPAVHAPEAKPHAANDNHAHGHGGGVSGFLGFWFWDLPWAIGKGLAKEMSEIAKQEGGKGGGGGHAKKDSHGGGGGHH